MEKVAVVTRASDVKPVSTEKHEEDPKIITKEREVLGDYLIFNTNSNRTVIQTDNKTTYLSCTMDESDSGTIEYNGGSSNFSQPLTIAVPLTIEGPNYYFSDAEDGVQCQQGLSFEINVKHGLGLPPSLNQPPPPPYIEPPGPDTAQVPPDAVAGAAQPPKDDVFAAQPPKK